MCTVVSLSSVNLHVLQYFSKLVLQKFPDIGLNLQDTQPDANFSFFQQLFKIYFQNLSVSVLVFLINHIDYPRRFFWIIENISSPNIVLKFDLQPRFRPPNRFRKTERMFLFVLPLPSKSIFSNKTVRTLIETFEHQTDYIGSRNVFESYHFSLINDEAYLKMFCEYDLLYCSLRVSWFFWKSLSNEKYNENLLMKVFNSSVRENTGFLGSTKMVSEGL